MCSKSEIIYKIPGPDIKLPNLLHKLLQFTNKINQNNIEKIYKPNLNIKGNFQF